jgi:hypothetical protein
MPSASNVCLRRSLEIVFPERASALHSSSTAILTHNSTASSVGLPGPPSSSLRSSLRFLCLNKRNSAEMDIFHADSSLVHRQSAPGEVPGEFNTCRTEAGQEVNVDHLTTAMTKRLRSWVALSEDEDNSLPYHLDEQGTPTLVRSDCRTRASHHLPPHTKR